MSTSLTTNQRAVLVLVNFDQGAALEGIAHQTGLRPSRVSWALASLLGRGYVTSSHGRWYTTALGQRRLEGRRQATGDRAIARAIVTAIDRADLSGHVPQHPEPEAPAVIATYPRAWGSVKLHLAELGASYTLCGLELGRTASGTGVYRDGLPANPECQRCARSLARRQAVSS